MSLINQMLQELERRQATLPGVDETLLREIRPVHRANPAVAVAPAPPTAPNAA
ncbi:MAG: hypothetical protein HQL51_17070, partial [Magnetococcales bacterium]|nr:hypothetical protein [Magnetococcales bacterium]